MSSKYAHLDRRRYRAQWFPADAAVQVLRRPAISRLRYLSGGMRGYQQHMTRVFGAPARAFNAARLPAHVRRRAGLRIARRFRPSIIVRRYARGGRGRPMYHRVFQSPSPARALFNTPVRRVTRSMRGKM